MRPGSSVFTWRNADGPGGTQVPRRVVEAMSEYLLCHNAITHWRYPTSQETDEIIGSARRAVADFLNAAPDQIAFGNNMTTLTFHLARALGLRREAGDEVVVTELDHHANIDPWRRLAQERGLEVRTVAMPPETGELDWDDFERQVTRRTRLGLSAISAVLAMLFAAGIGMIIYIVFLMPRRRNAPFSSTQLET